MVKQQTVITSLGPLTFSSLGMAELRDLDRLFKENASATADDKGISLLIKYMPSIHASARKVHQDMTLEQLEAGLDLEDFNACFDAVMSVSGLKVAEKKLGEAQIPEAIPV